MTEHLFEPLSPVTRGRQWRERPRVNTGFLYSTPGFLSGMASVLDIFGNLGRYNYSRTGKEADFRALYSDYRMIGQDIEGAMESLEMRRAKTFAGQGRLFGPEDTTQRDLPGSDEANRAT
jgi:hypothetical protein